MSGDDDDRIFERMFNFSVNIFITILILEARANLETLVYKEFVNKIVFECYNAYLKAKKQGITDITEEVIYANLEPEASAEDKENVDPEPKVYVECDICSEKVIVSRYTNHRSKCSGNGRRCNM